MEVQKTLNALRVDERADIVYALEEKIIDLTLKTSNGIIEPINGFLVEVYSRDANNNLKKMYRENIENPIDENNEISDVFSNYFTLETI